MGWDIDDASQVSDAPHMSVFRRCVLSGSKSKEILYFERETTLIFAVLESIDYLITELGTKLLLPASKFSDFSNLVFIYFVLHRKKNYLRKLKKKIEQRFITIVLTKIKFYLSYLPCNYPFN